MGVVWHYTGVVRRILGCFGISYCTFIVLIWKVCIVYVDRHLILHIYNIYLLLGVPGSNNDINVNGRSPMWADIAAGEFPSAQYRIGESVETQLYFTADNIYPRYPVFIQSFGTSSDSKEAYFSKRLESVRKDVERAFGILQSRFESLKKNSLYWYVEDLHNEVMCCIILHNMILQDERSHNDRILSTSLLPSSDYHDGHGQQQYPLDMMIANLHSSQSLNKFITLREALMENLYNSRRM